MVYDIDSTVDSVLTVTLECSKGELILGNSSGLIVDGLRASESQSVASPASILNFNATVAGINRAMRNLRYRGLRDQIGRDVIRIAVTDDPGPCPGDFNFSVPGVNTTKAAPCALGGRRTTEGEIKIFLTAVNHPPSISVPESGTSHTAVDAELAANLGAGGQLSLEDPDIRETVYYTTGGRKVEGPLSVAVIAADGRLSLDRREGLSFSEGEGISDPALRFSGSIDDANSALATLSYRCSSVNGCIAGSHNVTVFVDDNGFTGRGGPLSATATFAIEVAGAS